MTVDLNLYPGYKGWGGAEADADFKATGGAGKGASGGGSGVDLGQIDSLLGSQRANTTGFLAGQNAQSSDYLKRYTEFINGQEGASAMASRIGNELGIPGLQKNAVDYRNLLTNLPGTYSAATRGYDVNNNQLQRIVGQKSSELSPLVETTERSLAGAQNVLGQRMGYEQADQAKELLPYQTEKELMSDRMARETTLFSQDQENELSSLISKLQMGITLSENEKDRAQQLAISERDYNLEKEKLNAGSTQIIEVGGRKKLIDTRTGATIADLGSSGSGGSAVNPSAYLGNNNGMQSVPTSSPKVDNRPPLSSLTVDPYKASYDAANARTFGASTNPSLNGINWNSINLGGIKGL